MKYLKTLKSAWVAVVMAALTMVEANPAEAQTTPDLVGAWRGAATPEAAQAAAAAVLTPEARAVLGVPADVGNDDIAASLTAPWLHYLLRYDPAVNLSRIEVPVLVLIGSLDRQVPPTANLAAIREALADNPDATLVELPGLNHLFQTAPTGAIGEYAVIEETFSPAALALISEWIDARFSRR